MYSIYHFFADLYRRRILFEHFDKLGEFPYDRELLSCVNNGTFPDLVIRINPGGNPSGGELDEVKDIKKYNVSSFNSTIPTGEKHISSITQGKSSKAREQMEAAGEDVFALPIREVYYLCRGRKDSNTKICLIHGSFFETVKVE